MTEVLKVIESELVIDDEYYNIDKFKDLDLEGYEKIIKDGLKHFVEIGAALYFIKKGNLYDKTYSNFDRYCIKRWGFTQRHADRLIDAFIVVTEMIEFQKTRPIGLPLIPQTESQARELKPIQNEDRVKILQELKENNLTFDAKKIKDKVSEIMVKPFTSGDSVSSNRQLKADSTDIVIVAVEEPTASSKTGSDSKKQLLRSYKTFILNKLTALTDCNSVEAIETLQSDINKLFCDLIDNYKIYDKSVDTKEPLHEPLINPDGVTEEFNEEAFDKEFTAFLIDIKDKNPTRLSSVKEKGMMLKEEYFRGNPDVSESIDKLYLIFKKKGYDKYNFPRMLMQGYFPNLSVEVIKEIVSYDDSVKIKQLIFESVKNSYENIDKHVKKKRTKKIKSL